MSSSTSARDEFFTVKEINSMAQSHVGSKITKPVSVVGSWLEGSQRFLLVGDSESELALISLECVRIGSKRFDFQTSKWRLFQKMMKSK